MHPLVETLQHLSGTLALFRRQYGSNPRFRAFFGNDEFRHGLGLLLGQDAHLRFIENTIVSKGAELVVDSLELPHERFRRSPLLFHNLPNPGLLFFAEAQLRSHALDEKAHEAFGATVAPGCIGHPAHHPGQDEGQEGDGDQGT
jgi:hypothetical protein